MESESLQWRRSFKPFWQAYRLWLRADCDDLSAAFAYHTLQSFFPALLIILALVSRLLGRDRQLLERLIDLVSRVLPVSALPGFEATLDRFTRQGVGAGILGIVLLVLSASNIYLTLQRGADRLWWNRPFGFDGLTWQQTILRFLALRFKALFLLLVVGLLIVLDQLIRNLRFFGSSMIRSWLLDRLPFQWLGFGSVSTGVDVALSFLISFFAALIFLWLLPSRRIPLRPLLPGALLVSQAITLLNLVLGRSLVLLGLRFQAYGVVGGVLALTLWVWLVGVILYYGQCLSVVLARRSQGGHSTLLADQRRVSRGPG
jgi:membrane protein